MAEEYIKIWCSCLETWAPLTDEEVGQLVRALCTYKRTGELPNLSGGPMYVFPSEKARLDRDSESYDKRCEANRLNGAKGGRPSKPKESEEDPLGFDENQKSQEEEKEKEKEKDKDKDISSPPIPPKAKRGAKKLKEPKVQFATYVSMTNDEYQKLLDTHGQADTARLIEILDNYKGSSGKHYASDYRAILSWVTDRLAEEKARGRKQPTGAFASGDRRSVSTEEQEAYQKEFQRMQRQLERMRNE